MTSLSYLDILQKGITKKSLNETTNGWSVFYNLLCSYSFLDEGIFDVMVTDNSGNLYSYTTYMEQKKVESMAGEASRKPGYSPIAFLGNHKVFTIAKPFYHYDITQYSIQRPMENRIGTCIFFMNTDYLNKMLNSVSHPSGIEFYIVDSKGSLVAQSGSADRAGGNNELFHKRGHFGNQGYLFKFHQRRYISYTYELNKSGWKVYEIMPANTNLTGLSKTRNLIFLIWGIVVFMIISLVFLFINSINNFIATLMTHMEKIKQGIFDVKIKPWKKREFSMVANGFNSMMEKIIFLTEQNINIQKQLYEEDLDKKRVTLMALQSQINPHFLYNTLECLKDIGIYYNIHEIKLISESLGCILNYSMNGRNIVQLSEEIKVVRHYLDIQEIRFNNKFQIEYDFDAGIEGVLIPKLILQPIVENTIRHGLEAKMSNCLLKIAAKFSASEMIITVSDNGVGMEDEEYRELVVCLENTDKIPEGSKGIGLINVKKRLLLYYGTKAALSILSHLGKGTIVRITVPQGIR